MQVTDASGYIFGPKGLQVNGADGKPKVITSGGGGNLLKGTASGVDTYTTTISGVTSYNDGDAYLIRFTTGNTTGATLNINGLGAVPLYRNNDGKVIGGDIEDGAEMICVYNSTLSVFQVIGTSPNTLLAYVTNAESVTITKGQPVYAFGGQGDRLKVKLAYNSTDATSAQTVGLVLSTSIGANQKGFIILNGQLDGLSILPTSTWADGDPVYLGATAGTITKVKPSAPNHLVYLGFVTTANNGSAGRMYVRVQNGYELEELHDVQISGLADNDIIQYDLATDLWQNKSLSNAGIQPTLVSGSNIKTVNSNSLVGSGDVSVQSTLISGTNIKTVNSTSLLGSGDVAVQPTLVSGTNIKTVNSNSLLGSGNIAVQATLTSGGNIRSINNQTLLTSGNLNIFQQLINTGGSVITGTTANSISTSTTISSTFLGAATSLQLRVKILKTIGGATPTDIRLYINTANSLSGATLIATAQQMTSTGSFQHFWRDIFINGSTMYFYPASTPASNDLTNYTAGTFTIAASTAYFFIVAIQHGNTTDSAQVLRTQLFYAV